ncbi:hypothetical protein CFE70_009717 [Pyrenophora teres f. teres 0-1]
MAGSTAQCRDLTLRPLPMDGRLQGTERGLLGYEWQFCRLGRAASKHVERLVVVRLCDFSHSLHPQPTRSPAHHPRPFALIRRPALTNQGLQPTTRDYLRLYLRLPPGVSTRFSSLRLTVASTAGSCLPTPCTIHPSAMTVSYYTVSILIAHAPQSILTGGELPDLFFRPRSASPSLDSPCHARPWEQTATGKQRARGPGGDSHHSTPISLQFSAIIRR